MAVKYNSIHTGAAIDEAVTDVGTLKEKVSSIQSELSGGLNYTTGKSFNKTTGVECVDNDFCISKFIEMDTTIPTTNKGICVNFGDYLGTSKLGVVVFYAEDKETIIDVAEQSTSAERWFRNGFENLNQIPDDAKYMRFSFVKNKVGKIYDNGNTSIIYYKSGIVGGIDKDVEQAVTDITALKSRMSAAETKNSTQDTSIAAIGVKITSQGESIKQLDSAVNGEVKYTSNKAINQNGEIYDKEGYAVSNSFAIDTSKLSSGYLNATIGANDGTCYVIGYSGSTYQDWWLISGNNRRVSKSALEAKNIDHIVICFPLANVSIVTATDYTDISVVFYEANKIESGAIQNIKTISNDVSLLSNEINGIAIKKYTEGYTLNSSGVLVADADCCVTELIPINKQTMNSQENIRCWYGEYRSNIQFVLFRSDGSKIDSWGSYSSETNGYKDFSYSRITYDTAYIRFAFNKSYLNNARVESNYRGVIWSASEEKTDSFNDKINTITTKIEEETNYTDEKKLEYASGVVSVSDEPKFSISKELIEVKSSTTYKFYHGNALGGTDINVYVNVIEYNASKVAINKIVIDTIFRATGTNAELNEENKMHELTTSAETKFLQLTFVNGYDAKLVEKSTLKTIWEKEYFDGLDKYEMPSYYYPYINIKVRDIRRKELQCGNGDSFVFLTDTHIENNALRSPILVKKIVEATSVNKVFHGGDFMDMAITKEIAATKISRWFELYSFCDTFATIGNHDINTAGNAYGYPSLSNDEIYSLLIKQNEGKISDNRKNYYYVDNPSQNIRYYFLDCHWTSETDPRNEVLDYNTQLSWLETTCSELDSTWSVVVIQHIIYAETTFDTDGKSVIAATKTALANSLISKLNTIKAADNKPDVIALIGGHTHYDWSEMSSSGFPILVTDSDATYGFTGGKDWRWCNYRLKGTIDEQSFDVFHIDKTNRKLYATRIGYGNDRVWNF